MKLIHFNIFPRKLNIYVLYGKLFDELSKEVCLVFISRFNHIVVDTVSTKHHRQFNVIFVVTLEGTVKKYVELPGGRNLCLIEQLQVVPPGSKPGLVKTMKLAAQEVWLFVYV
jgi:hypothetical protein